MPKKANLKESDDCHSKGSSSQTTIFQYYDKGKANQPIKSFSSRKNTNFKGNSIYFIDSNQGAAENPVLIDSDSDEGEGTVLTLETSSSCSNPPEIEISDARPGPETGSIRDKSLMLTDSLTSNNYADNQLNTEHVSPKPSISRRLSLKYKLKKDQQTTSSDFDEKDNSLATSSSSQISVKRKSNDSFGAKPKRTKVESHIGETAQTLPQKKAEVKSDDISKDENIENSEEPTENYTPYYLENFEFVIKSVIENEDNLYLFNDGDLKTLHQYNSLPETQKKLYIRLFLRKHKWVLKKKIKYPKIEENHDSTLDYLVQSGLLLDETSIFELEECLDVLPAPEVKVVATSLRLNTEKTTRDQLIQDILKHTKKKNLGTMFGLKSNIRDSVFKRAKELLNCCYKLESVARSLFLRIITLFSLTTSAFDEDTGGQEQLFHLLQVNRGDVVYPDYKLSENRTRIFRNREDLIQYQIGLQLDFDIRLALERHEFDSALNIHNNATNKFEELLMNQEMQRHNLSLETYLRVFTTISIYMRVMSHGVETLQKQKNFTEAIIVLRKLLHETDYCLLYRGAWWDRLALNLEAHLKKPSEALDIIAEALKDPHVKTGRRLALFQRAEKICNSKSGQKLKKRLKEFRHPEIQEAPKVMIEGQLFPKELPTGKTIFVTRQASNGDEEDHVTMCSVEDVALKHYKDVLGYNQGIHGEGSTFCTLFALFMWDIIFMDGIPNTFYTLYQMAPLDMYTDEFYKKRETEIVKRLDYIQHASTEDMLQIVEKTWNENYGKSCIGINWELFSSLDHLKSLIKCFGGKFWSGVLKRQAVDYRHTCSGLPDLVVWNTTDNTCRIVEVKGPRDRLSTKQILWLDYFLQLGANAEVCHVSGIGSKKLRLQSIKH